MSVLIKGMKMPQSCFDCDMLELSGVVGCKHAYDTKNSEWGRALNCLLIDLPDHGDLIDKDALVDKAEFICDAFSGRAGFVVWANDVVNAPVVIPAERSEE